MKKSYRELKPDFSKSVDGLIPAIVQHIGNREVLMLGYMNEEAFERTIDTEKATFFSRSRNQIWLKGETSGNYLHVKNIKLDCDRDTLLIFADPDGPTCHTGEDTCFGPFEKSDADLGFLNEVIKDRKKNPKENSYTNQLLDNLNKAAQKVGEEAVEMVIEAKDDNRDLFLNEAADLMYHYLVLLQAKDEDLSDVINVLKSRFK